jgi:hypothetical protein
VTELPAGFRAWATPPAPPPAGPVPDALAARGLPRDAGLDVLLAHERQQALRAAYRRVTRLSRGSTRGSWAQAASLLHRMIGGEP